MRWTPLLVAVPMVAVVASCSSGGSSASYPAGADGAPDPQAIANDACLGQGVGEASLQDYNHFIAASAVCDLGWHNVSGLGRTPAAVVSVLTFTSDADRDAFLSDPRVEHPDRPDPGLSALGITEVPGGAASGQDMVPAGGGLVVGTKFAVTIQYNAGRSPSLKSIATLVHGEILTP